MLPGTGNSWRAYQRIDQLLFRFLLGCELLLMEDRLVDCIPQLRQRLEISEIAGEFVVERRKFFSADHFRRQLKTDGLAGRFSEP